MVVGCRGRGGGGGGSGGLMSGGPRWSLLLEMVATTPTTTTPTTFTTNTNNKYTPRWPRPARRGTTRPTHTTSAIHTSNKNHSHMDASMTAPSPQRDFAEASAAAAAPVADVTALLQEASERPRILAAPCTRREEYASALRAVQLSSTWYVRGASAFIARSVRHVTPNCAYSNP